VDDCGKDHLVPLLTLPSDFFKDVGFHGRRV
jgi:hypothetical protein